MKLLNLKRLLALWIALFAVVYGSAHAEQGMLPAIDFKEVFPHIYWVSSVGRDREFPTGFQYKVLSVRLASQDVVEFVLVRQLQDGSKTVEIHAKGPVSSFDATAGRMTDNLGKKLDVKFERHDLSNVRSSDELTKRASALGWGQAEWSP